MTYKRKIKELPHTRLAPEKIYDILFLVTSELSSGQIAKRTELPTQTVKRNIDRIRRSLFHQEDFVTTTRDYFWIRTVDNQDQNLAPLSLLLIDAALTILFSEHAEEISADLYTCLYKCPSFPSVNYFLKTRFKIETISYQHYFPHANSGENVIKVEKTAKSKGNCKLCPLKLCAKIPSKAGERISETPDYLANYDKGLIISHILFYVSQFRCRDPKDFIYCYTNAVLYALWTHRFVYMQARFDLSKVSYNQIQIHHFQEYTGYLTKCMGLLGYNEDFTTRLPPFPNDEPINFY